MRMPTASPIAFGDRSSGVAAHSKRTGVIITIATASKSHHAIQVIMEGFNECATPTASAKAGAPATIPELMAAVGTKDMARNLAMDRVDANVLRPSDQRLISQAPASAASVVAIAAAAASKIVVFAEIAPAESDPAPIAGQIRLPRSRTILRATPVGGHNGVAIALSAGSNSAPSARPK